MSEPEYDFDDATAQIDAKLTETDACILKTVYSVVDELMKTGAVDALEHLLSEHDQIEAAEFSLALMRYIVFAGQLEERLFRAARITAVPRFDAAANAEELLAVETIVGELRIANAVIEGEGRVRH